MPADIIDFTRARQARAVAEQAQEQQTQEQQQQRSALARAATMFGISRKQKKINQLKKEIGHWTEEREANERKKQTCMILLILALGDDVIDIIAAFVSFGMLSSITFPIPGIIRGMVAVQERTPKPDRLIRAIGAMAIEAIPGLNLLPTTTINLLIDLIEAVWDEEQAKNEIEKREQQIKKIQEGIRNDSRSAMRIARGMAQSAIGRRAA